MKKLFAILLVFILLIASSLCVNAETPELPENNKLLSDEWVKGLGSATVKKETVDGQDVYTISNINSTYASPYLDLYPTVKALIGDESEVSVYIVLDVRVVNTEENSGAEFPFGMKLRPSCTALTKSEDAFNENYGADADSFKHQYGSVSASMVSGLAATEEWQRVEITKTFIDFDINDEFWTRWNLCFDGMHDFANGASLQVKNAGVFLEDEYVPLEKEEEATPKPDDKYITPVTPTPVTIYRPYGFDKYTATFSEVKEQENAAAPNGGLTNGDANGGEGKIIITASIIAAVIIIAGLTVTITVIKKNKKEGKGDAEE